MKPANGTLRAALAALTLALVLTIALPATAQEPVGRTDVDDVLPFFDLYFQTYLYVANDRDFDRTEPVYSENGQTSGFVATTLRPGITWVPQDHVTVRYQFEVGDNIWSRNDLDVNDPTGDNQAVLRHKEIWAEVHTADDRFALRTGYQYLHDPTHLVLDKHIGAAVAAFAIDSDNGLALAVGQVPDTVYEGLDATGADHRTSDNNFENDDYVFGLTSRSDVNSWILNGGVFVRWDKTEVNRPLMVLSPMFHADGCVVYGEVCVDLDVVGQWGRHSRAGLDNRDVDILAGAAQAGLLMNFWPIGWDWHVLAFTADDGDKYDQYDTGFRYSGWSKSRTMLLTMNWLHDQYNNIDESVAAQGAGLLVGDQEFSVTVVDGVRLFAIAGAGMTLDDTNTGGEKYLGTEGQLGAEWAPYEGLVSFHLIGGGLLPGKAAAMLRNEIDREATDPLGAVQADMAVSF